MSIIQISKIQQRAGNLVDLPQLDEAEIGFASDAKRVFIGKTTSGLENIEVLTSYSDITFSQIDGSVGNLNISNVTVADGQVLVYDGNNWVNRGGDAGGLVDLGEISNVAIDGGSVGYTIETDGLGNLSWTPKGTITAYIENVSQANPGEVTSTVENFLTDGQEVTITDAVGMTELNGGTYYANVQSSTTFTLYSDTNLLTPVDTSTFTEYAFSSVASSNTVTKRVTIGDSSVFSVNDPVRFTGDMDSESSLINTGTTYYVNAIPSGTTIVLSDTIYANGIAGPEKPIGTATGLTANVFGYGGRAIASTGGGGTSAAQGSNTSVQYNNSGIIDGDGDFTWDFSASKTLTVNGNANVGNLNATDSVVASRLFSNVATGTTPIVVDSTTRVANLNVDYANVADNSVVGNLTTGNYFPALVSTSATGNKPLNVSGSYTFDTANAKFVAGNVEATYDVSGSTLTGTLTTAAQPNVTSLGTLTSLEVAGDITPDANVTYDLGNNTNRFRDLYLSGSSITLGFQEITSNATHTTFTNRLAAETFVGNVVGILSGDAGNISNVQGANVAGEVNFAATANTVAGANVTGTVPLAAIASTVSGAVQSNITSVGTLTSLDVSGNLTAGNITATGGTLSGIAGNLTTLTVSGESDLGDVSNVQIDGGTANYILKTDGAGNLSWTNPDGGYFLHEQTVAATVWNVNHGLNRRYVGVEAIDGSGISYNGRYNYPTIEYVDANNLTMTWDTALSGFAAITGGGTNINSVMVAPATTPAGVDTQVQFNDAGALAGNNGLVFDKTTGTLTATVLEGPLATASQPNITSVGTLNGLEVSGNITPDANITYDLGNNTNRFNDLYLAGNTIYIGDQQITSNASGLSFTGETTSSNIRLVGNIEAATSNLYVTGEQGGANGYVHHDFVNNKHSFVGINSGLGPVSATVETEYFDALIDTDGVVPGMPGKMRLYMEGMQSYALDGTTEDAYLKLNQSSSNLLTPGPTWTAGHPSSTPTHIVATGNIAGSYGHFEQDMSAESISANYANIDGGTDITGNLNAGNITTANIVTQAATINGNATVVANLRVDGTIIVENDINLGVDNLTQITGNLVGLANPGQATIDLDVTGAAPGSSITLVGGQSGGIFGNTEFKATGGKFTATYNTSYFPAVGNPTFTEFTSGGMQGSAGPANVYDAFQLNNQATSNTTPGNVWSAFQKGDTSPVHISATGNIVGAGGIFNEVFTTELHAGNDPATSDQNTNGSIVGNWLLGSGSRLQATYADLAEYYEGEEVYEAGTVVSFGGTKEVHISDEVGSKRVAGVVSTDPAYIMNAECPGDKVAIALQGRVPCKVTGTCEKGDIMVSNGEGGATAWYHVVTIMHPGMTIGKAIEDKETNELSVIEIAVGRL
jgi:hypothetical protein